MIADAAVVLVAAALGPRHVHLSVDAEWDLGLLVLRGWFHCTRARTRTVSVFVLTDLSVINFQITTRICVLVAVAVAASLFICVIVFVWRTWIKRQSVEMG